MFDHENGKQRMLLLRPAVRQALQESFRQRRKMLERVFRSRGRAPLYLNEQFDGDTITHYFYG